jgi:energy-converting hydrogenase Eha subunit B
MPGLPECPDGEGGADESPSLSEAKPKMMGNCFLGFLDGFGAGAGGLAGLEACIGEDATGGIAALDVFIGVRVCLGDGT